MLSRCFAGLHLRNDYFAQGCQNGIFQLLKDGKCLPNIRWQTPLIKLCVMPHRCNCNSQTASKFASCSLSICFSHCCNFSRCHFSAPTLLQNWRLLTEIQSFQRNFLTYRPLQLSSSKHGISKPMYTKASLEHLGHRNIKNEDQSCASNRCWQQKGAGIPIVVVESIVNLQRLMMRWQTPVLLQNR